MATQSIAQRDHQALDSILTRLESRYGHDPRVERAFRIFMSDRIDLSVVDPKAGLVHGDTGRSYWATVDAFCECPDHANGHVCKHALAVMIAAQMRAVMKAKQAQQPSHTRATYIQLCQEQQKYGQHLHSRGIRPIDDSLWLERDQQIQMVKAQLPVPTLIR
jgi:hypothetical protein